jgi:phosphopantothenoylcysteine decarboxylase/phosphopantothenate--cysteine ligase
MNSLKNKKILITAGPTWIPIDNVRVITNVFKGTLGFIIAKEAVNRGAKVTLLLGPSSLCPVSKAHSKLRIIRFRFFEDIYKLMKKEISSKKYDVVIQSAAIGDYAPIQFFNGKIKSGKKNLIIKLKPTIKIIDQIKKWDKKVFLVKFKVESDSLRKDLIEGAYKSMLFSNADLIVANDLKYMKGNKHKAFILDSKKNIIICNKKTEIAKKLLNTIVKTC